MNKVSISDLPMEKEKDYQVTINKVLGGDISLVIEDQCYLIRKPTNKSWAGTVFTTGMICTVRLVRYPPDSDKLRLELSKVLKDSDPKVEMPNNITPAQDYLSTTKIAEAAKVDKKGLMNTLEHQGWVEKPEKARLLLKKGEEQGGKYKYNDKGEKWIIWPKSILHNPVFISEILHKCNPATEKKAITSSQSGSQYSAKPERSAVPVANSKTLRKFELPGEDDLNKDQDQVYELPEDGQFLVVGGPGTGKSVVALLRALKYHKNNNYSFLVYNHVLHSSTNQLIDIALNSNTLDSWFYTLQKNLTKKLMPEVAPYKPDYDEVIGRFKQASSPSHRPEHLIIDEGQDKPPKFYESTMHAGYENFFIVADQNQQITDDNSSRQDLTDRLGLDVSDVIELKENYRNSLPIAKFSAHFFMDPASPKPDLPPDSKISLGIPTLYEYKAETGYKCIELILREYDKDVRNLIGVIVADDKTRDSVVDALTSHQITLDNPRPQISTYSSKDKANTNIDFGHGGIVVLNDKSVKGLEFDIVFIIIDGFKAIDNDIDGMKKRFYVMSSRAIKKLVLFITVGYKVGEEGFFPEDESILKRDTL